MIAVCQFWMSSSGLMGRPPCCEKADVKKGPWTPEEDLVLGSYIQEHGPGSWKAVPTKTGLMRCSKSCRLRWTNYLRPGIKRGSFTEQEEKLIVHLQALFGNRWATIASYLPERTDNDVKNYWNTHLKKKLNIIQTLDQEGGAAVTAASQPAVSKGRWETRVRADIHMAKRALDEALALALQDKPIGSASASAAMTTTTTTTAAAASSTTTYASSAENIARLLRGWMENRTSSPKTTRSYYSTSTGAASSATAATSQNNFPISSAMDSSSLLFDLDARNLERSETDLSHGDVKIPNPTYSLFESWLFEEEESMEEVESFAYV